MDKVREREMVSPGDFSGWRCCLMAVQGCFAQFPLKNCGWGMLVGLGDRQVVAGFQQGKGRVRGAQLSILLEEGCSAHLLPRRTPEGGRNHMYPVLNGI